MALDERKAREIAIVVNKKVENEVMNARGFCPIVLEEIEVRPARFIQCDNLTIDYGVVREISESVKDQGILSIEGISPSGKQVQLTGRFHGDGSISIEFDFEKPVRAVRELRDS